MGSTSDDKQNSTYETAQWTANWLKMKTSHEPEIGIICGSGLGGLADVLEDVDKFDYKDIPNFPVGSVKGHACRLLFGTLNGKSCMVMQGRIHYYEGCDFKTITFPIKVMKLIGITTLILTTACGGLNPSYKAGDIMLIKDHINLLGLAGQNPLVGPNDERFGPRFPAMSDAYDCELRKITKKIAEDLNFSHFLQEGVYSVQGGPCFETVAECRLIRLIGADVTGMSTAPEVTVARHCGIKCLGLALVTNMCILDEDSAETANHEEVLETGKQRGDDMKLLVTKVIGEIET